MIRTKFFLLGGFLGLLLLVFYYRFTRFTFASPAITIKVDGYKKDLSNNGLAGAKIKIHKVDNFYGPCKGQHWGCSPEVATSNSSGYWQSNCTGEVMKGILVLEVANPQGYVDGTKKPDVPAICTAVDVNTVCCNVEGKTSLGGQIIFYNLRAAPTPTMTITPIPTPTPAKIIVSGQVINSKTGLGIAGATVMVHKVDDQYGPCNGQHFGCGTIVTDSSGRWKTICNADSSMKSIYIAETKNATGYIDSSRYPDPAGGIVWDKNRVCYKNAVARATIGPVNFYDQQSP